jgi:S-DNA-T family DNA segregation ATPase FtsK/SpoIIIE
MMNTEPSSETRLRHQLDIQSRQINRVMSHHRVPAVVSGGEIQPRAVSFDLQTQITASLERIRGLKDDLIKALGVGDVALSSEDDRWRLRVARPDDPPVPLLKLLDSIENLPARTAAIGLAEDGPPVLLSFSTNKTSHVLIAGEVGAGKTTLLRTIAVSLALANRQSELQLQVLDPGWPADDNNSPGMHPLMPLGYLPHMMTDPALGVAACAPIIHFLAEEMNYRRLEHVVSPRIVVLVDHALTFLEESEPSARDDLLRLLQYGARAGIHIVMATDRPESPLLDSTIRASICTNIVGHLSDAVTAKRVAGIRLDQATLLYGEGDFLLVGGGEVTYFQAAHIGDYDLHLKLGQLLDPNRPRLLAQPYNGRLKLAKGKPKDDQVAKSFSMRDGSVDLDVDSPVFDAPEDI